MLRTQSWVDIKVKHVVTGCDIYHVLHLLPHIDSYTLVMLGAHSSSCVAVASAQAVHSYTVVMVINCVTSTLVYLVFIVCWIHHASSWCGHQLPKEGGDVRIADLAITALTQSVCKCVFWDCVSVKHTPERSTYRACSGVCTDCRCSCLVTVQYWPGFSCHHVITCVMSGSFPSHAMRLTSGFSSYLIMYSPRIEYYDGSESATAWLNSSRIALRVAAELQPEPWAREEVQVL